MNRILAATAIALALAVPGAGFAEGMNFDDTIETIFETAKTRPDFQMNRTCPPAGQPGLKCQTVASATRAPDADGRIGQGIFIKFDGDDHKMSCFRNMNGTNTHTRVCEKFDAAASNGEHVWIEAYFPSKKTWEEIATEPKVAACANLQMSEYEVDDAYADCVVSKMEHDAAAAEVEAQAKAEAKDKAEAARPRIEAEVKAKIEAKRAQIEADAKAAVRAQIEDDLRAKMVADAKAKAEADAKADIEAATQAKDKALEDAKAAASARLEAEAIARHDDEVRKDKEAADAKVAADAKAKADVIALQQDQIRKDKELADAKVRQEARAAAEATARHDEQVRADKAAAQHNAEEEARIAAEAEAAHEAKVSADKNRAAADALAERENLTKARAIAEREDEGPLASVCNALPTFTQTRDNNVKRHIGNDATGNLNVKQARVFCDVLRERGMADMIHRDTLDLLTEDAPAKSAAPAPSTPLELAPKP
jgi:hypothetical protein